MGVHLIDVYLWTCICFQTQKGFGGTLQIPHLTNGGRFIEIRVVKYEFLRVCSDPGEHPNDETLCRILFWLDDGEPDMFKPHLRSRFGLADVG
jgi:hypothetical protein